MEIGQKLKNRRKELGLTMLQVATKVGVSEATVSRWESGDIANMKRDKIVLLANALQVSPSYIMGDGELPYSDDNSVSTNDSFALSTRELSLINKYNKLNTSGKDKTDSYIDDLLENRRYTDKIIELNKVAFRGGARKGSITEKDDFLASELLNDTNNINEDD